MKISISERLHPFSHLPGTFCLIPGTTIAVKVFPSLFRFYDLSSSKKRLIEERLFDCQGPDSHFTVIQDLERGCVTVRGKEWHYHILPTLEIKREKHPGTSSSLGLERLSLGMHKKQEWEGVRKRLDMREIFPLWFRLGSLLPAFDKTPPQKGMFELLNRCQQAIEVHRPEQILPHFRALFLAGFEGMLVPRLVDEEFQGILPHHYEEPEISPLVILSASFQLIRSLFITSSSSVIHLLPNLPPEFFAGRFLNVRSECGEIDFEWTKKMMRQVIFRPQVSERVTFLFPSGVSDFRLRQSEQEKGYSISAGHSFEVVSGSIYYLDRFQK